MGERDRFDTFRRLADEPREPMARWRKLVIASVVSLVLGLGLVQGGEEPGLGVAFLVLAGLLLTVGLIGAVLRG